MALECSPEEAARLQDHMKKSKRMSHAVKKGKSIPKEKRCI